MTQTMMHVHMLKMQNKTKKQTIEKYCTSTSGCNNILANIQTKNNANTENIHRNKSLTTDKILVKYYGQYLYRTNTYVHSFHCNYMYSTFE